MTREEREQLNEDIFDLFVNKLGLFVIEDDDTANQSEDLENNAAPI